MTDLDSLVSDFKAEHGFSDAAWDIYSDAQNRASEAEDESSKLRDIARRASVLARWFSREDFPYVDFTAEDRSALNADAEALVVALQRHGYYPEGWGA
jgi:hypothetical protein